MGAWHPERFYERPPWLLESSKSKPGFCHQPAKRATEQAAATARFMVKSVNKDGSISRMAPTRNDWKYDAFATAEDAEKRRAQLQAMNPGSRYAVVAL